MADTTRVDFTRASAERIGRVVAAYENAVAPGKPLTFERPHGTLPNEIKEITWSSNWFTGNTQLITFKVAQTTATASNFIMGLGPGEGWAAKSSGEWRLVSFNLTLQPGYAATHVQFVGHNSTNGLFQWYSRVTCT